MPVQRPSFDDMRRIPIQRAAALVAILLLALMAFLAGGAALSESPTVDEMVHIGAGVSYLQKLDLRMNEEHPPLAKMLAALPLVLRDTYADYSGVIWTASQEFLTSLFGEWIFGAWLVTRWNDPLQHSGVGSLSDVAFNACSWLDSICVRAPSGRRVGRSALPHPLRQCAGLSHIRPASPY